MLSQLVRYTGVYGVAVITAGLTLIWVVLRNRKKQDDTKKAVEPSSESLSDSKKVIKKFKAKPHVRSASFNKIRILYATQTGTAKIFADLLSGESINHKVTSELIDLKTCDAEDDLSSEDDGETVYVFITSTYSGGKPPDGYEWFFTWIEEAVNDFRVSKTHLSSMKYCVLGLGNSLYGDEMFCKAGRNLDRWLLGLGATRLIPVGQADENVATSKHGGVENDFSSWKKQFWRAVEGRLGSGFSSSLVTTKKVTVAMALDDSKVSTTESKCCKDETSKCTSCGCKNNDKTTTKPGDVAECVSSEDDESAGSEMEEEEEEGMEDEVHPEETGDLVDLEDLGKMMNGIKKAKAKRSREEIRGGAQNGEPREMLTPLLRKSLEKQGYKLIGSHSGVKLCRWTKSMLRGRGGCYKHTFYGIESHRCMEATPSLACANKCVFCWRHHTNPVGTEWKWQMDEPQKIFDEAVGYHVNLIRQFRGVPGVKEERFVEGLTPRHCALSLVGEPIMYPEINKLVELLHSKHISTFLVTNAQFPDAIRNLLPVTQLYVSVDASTKDSLKKIDRPLFKDFWERFMASLQALADKGQRTVYRLTLVKGFNTTELQNYADLVSIGQPDFIEIKGVTYCGESKASSLTMDNVPWHEEVVGFVQQLAGLLPQYEIASEHAHSNCVLLAHTKFKVDNVWWTWINYDKFHSLMTSHSSSNGSQAFTALDYMAPTPAWAVYGAEERGFDPIEERFFRKRKGKDEGGCG